MCGSLQQLLTVSSQFLLLKFCKQYLSHYGGSMCLEVELDYWHQQWVNVFGGGARLLWRVYWLTNLGDNDGDVHQDFSWCSKSCIPCKMRTHQLHCPNNQSTISPYMQYAIHHLICSMPYITLYATVKSRPICHTKSPTAQDTAFLSKFYLHRPAYRHDFNSSSNHWAFRKIGSTQNHDWTKGWWTIVHF